MDNFCFYSKNLNYAFEDTLDVENFKEDFKIFLRCLDKFFELENSKSFKHYCEEPQRWHFLRIPPKKLKSI